MNHRAVDVTAVYRAVGVTAVYNLSYFGVRSNDLDCTTLFFPVKLSPQQLMAQVKVMHQLMHTKLLWEPCFENLISVGADNHLYQWQASEP